MKNLIKYIFLNIRFDKKYFIIRIIKKIIFIWVALVGSLYADVSNRDEVSFIKSNLYKMNYLKIIDSK